MAKAPKDGYTILFGTSATQGIAKYMYKDLPYDLIEDFMPVGMVGNVMVGVFASEQSGIRTMEKMVAAIRAQPRRGELRLSGCWQRFAPCRRTVQVAHQAQHAPRALCRHRAADDGPRRWPDLTGLYRALQRDNLC